LTLAADLGLVAVTAIFAVFVRDNFVPYGPHLEAVIAYAAIAVVVAAPLFLATGLHKGLWQYTSLTDVLRITAVVTITLLLAVFISFAASRLENVARSVPLIQWLLLISAMIGMRLTFRIWHERARREPLVGSHNSVRHVLVVGLSHLTELYLES